jgi:hypothetical protein
MKASHIAILAILAGVKVLIAVSTAHAQDFTQMDITAMNNDWNAQQNAMMNDQLNQMIWANVNDPQVQALYVQQVNAGMFYGSIQDFAYKYIVTGGMSAAGYATAMGTNAQIDAQHQQMMNGYWNSMGTYQNAYDTYGNRYAQNQNTAGGMLMGN